jgi:hypothetical protein
LKALCNTNRLGSRCTQLTRLHKVEDMRYR